MKNALIHKIYKKILLVTLFFALGGIQANAITIGWTSYPADIPVIADSIKGGKDEAKRLWADVLFALAAGPAAQANSMDDLIARGVDVLAVNPEESKAIGASVKKANAAGIPVVMWIGDNLGGGTTVSLVSSDEELGGYSIAKWGFNRLGGQGRVVFIQGAIAIKQDLKGKTDFVVE